MPIPVRISGTTEGGVVRDADIHRSNGDSGLVVFTEPLREKDILFQFALNSTLGFEMAIDASFGGTPDLVHDGIDNVGWTASAISGSKFTFNSTDQANTGTQSVKTANASLGDVMQFDKGSDINLASYAAISMFIYVGSGWGSGSTDSFSLYGWDVGTGTQEGSAVLLEDYFNEVQFGEWQRLTIPLTDMGIEGTSLDGFRIEATTKTGSGPTFYIDDFNVQETSGASHFDIVAPKGTVYEINEVDFTIIDAHSTVLASNSMLNLSYDTFLGQAKLTNGIGFSRIRKGVSLFSASLTCLADSLRGGARLVNPISDGTNTSITLATDFVTPVFLEAKEDDKIRITVADDLSGFISFTAVAKGSVRQV